jgi:hypothetical protein
MPALSSWRRLIALALLCFCGSARSMVIPLSLEQLSRDADVIAVGRVVAVTAERRGPLIYSLAKIAVEQAVKGDAGTEITIESAGGRIGNEVFAVSEAATYEPGERVVVFLKKSEKRNIYTTLGAHQGKLLVRDGRVDAQGLSLAALLERVRATLGGTSR